MRHDRVPLTSLMLVALVTITGCANRPEPAATAEVQAPPPKVTLNLPSAEPVQACDCDAVQAASENYFDRGVRALAARDYAQARIYFERHRESAIEDAQREADVGLAFVTLMSDAGFEDDIVLGDGMDERAEVMILALAALQTLEGRIEALNALNQALSKDLKKREEVLKRLRDLTLGQQEG